MENQEDDLSQHKLSNRIISFSGHGESSQTTDESAPFLLRTPNKLTRETWTFRESVESSRSIGSSQETLGRPMMTRTEASISKLAWKEDGKTLVFQFNPKVNEGQEERSMTPLDFDKFELISPVDGSNPLELAEFMQTFAEVVDQADLSDALKFRCLKTKLTGEALDLVKDHPPGVYQHVFEMLHQEFMSKPHVTWWLRNFARETIQVTNEEDETTMTTFINQASTASHTIEHFHLDVSCESDMFKAFAKKLPWETLRPYIKRLGRNIPVLSELVEHLHRVRLTMKNRQLYVSDPESDLFYNEEMLEEEGELLTSQSESVKSPAQNGLALSLATVQSTPELTASLSSFRPTQGRKNRTTNKPRNSRKLVHSRLARSTVKPIKKKMPTYQPSASKVKQPDAMAMTQPATRRTADGVMTQAPDDLHLSARKDEGSSQPLSQDAKPSLPTPECEGQTLQIVAQPTKDSRMSAKKKPVSLQELEMASPVERRKMAHKYRLCFQCLGKGHRERYCQSKRICQHCQGGHHELLCQQTEAEIAKSSVQMQHHKDTKVIANDDTCNVEPFTNAILPTIDDDPDGANPENVKSSSIKHNDPLPSLLDLEQYGNSTPDDDDKWLNEFKQKFNRELTGLGFYEHVKHKNTLFKDNPTGDNSADDVNCEQIDETLANQFDDSSPPKEETLCHHENNIASGNNDYLTNEEPDDEEPPAFLMTELQNGTEGTPLNCKQTESRQADSSLPEVEDLHSYFHAMLRNVSSKCEPLIPSDAEKPESLELTKPKNAQDRLSANSREPKFYDYFGSSFKLELTDRSVQKIRRPAHGRECLLTDHRLQIMNSDGRLNDPELTKNCQQSVWQSCQRLTNTSGEVHSRGV